MKSSSRVVKPPVLPILLALMISSCYLQATVQDACIANNGLFEIGNLLQMDPA
ncbi:exported hypothetical protein [Marinoscillum sp. 108]|nr:exported hypothetical protein [Marinoscillum sp. 108]